MEQIWLVEAPGGNEKCPRQKSLGGEMGRFLDGGTLTTISLLFIIKKSWHWWILNIYLCFVDCFWYFLLREQKEKYSFEIRRRSIIFERAEGEVFFWGKSKKYSFEIRRRSILLTDQEEKYSAKKWAAVALPGFSHSSESPRWLWSVAVQPTSMTNWGQPSNFGCLSKHNLWDK